MESGSNGSALAVVEQSPSPFISESAVANWRRTTDIAGLVRAVVLNCTVEIQGRKYLTVAGYQAVANACGYVASARDVVRVEGGWQAIGEVRRLSDGMIISTGVGFLGDDEKMWATRPTFSKIAMVQTRACGRALRAACGFMAPLIDGKLETTPAEEMELVDRGSTTPPAPTTRAPASRGTAPLRETLRPSPPRSTPAPRGDSPPPHTDADFRADSSHDAATGEVAPTYDRNFVMPFANKKSEPLHALSEKSLKWFQAALTENINNPDKARFRDAACAQLRLIEAEMAYRGL